MKIASTKKENPSRVKPSPNTFPKLAMKPGHRSPSSRLRIVPVTTPTANSPSMTFDHRNAIERQTSSPVRRKRHSQNSTIAGKATPKQTSGMWTPSESACIWRASNRYCWSTGGNVWVAATIDAITGGIMDAGCSGCWCAPALASGRRPSQDDFRGRQREPLDLLFGEVWRERQRVGVDHQVDERRPAVSQRLGDRRHDSVLICRVGKRADRPFSEPRRS